MVITKMALKSLALALFFLAISACQESVVNGVPLDEISIPEGSSPRATFQEIDLSEVEDLFKGQIGELSTAGYNPDLENSIFLLSSHSGKSFASNLFLTPVLDRNEMFVGLIVKEGSEDSGTYYGYRETRDLLDGTDPICEDDLNAIASFLYLIELYVYQRLPDRIFS
ncbi:MAG: hypothetical protein AAFY36_15520, partial [Bacteroidota bacterium]